MNREARRRRVEMLYRQGLPASVIGKRLGVSDDAVYYDLRAAGVERRPRGGGYFPREHRAQAERARKLYVDERRTVVEIAAGLGIGEKLVTQHLNELGVKRRRSGRRAKHPIPLPRPCEYCGEIFTPKHPSAASGKRGRFCSTECKYAASRKYPQTEQRVCECGERFTPTPAQVAQGRGRFCSWCSVRRREQADHMRDMLSVQATRVQKTVVQLKADEDLIDANEYAEILEVHPSLISRYRDRLPKPSREKVCGRRFLLWRRSDAKRSVRERVFRELEDGRAALWLDDEFVLKQYRSRGWLARTMAARGLSEREAEAIIRDRVNRKRALRTHRRGRKPGTVQAHYFEWLREWEAAKPEPRLRSCEYGDCRTAATALLRIQGSPCGHYCATHAQLYDADAIEQLGPSKRQAALTIARRDFVLHPERWDYDPDAAREAAIKIVLYGVEQARKSLQKGGREIRAA